MSSSRRIPGPFSAIIAIAFALAGAAMGALYLFPDLQRLSRNTALVSSFIPYGLLGWAAAAVVVLLTTRKLGRLLVLVPLAGLIAQTMILVPYYDTSHLAPAGTASTLRVLTLNLHYGQADTVSLLTEVERSRPDVVVLTEFTTQSAVILDNPRWTTLLPYHLGTTGRAGFRRDWGDPSGTMVLSRTPLVDLGHTTGTIDTTEAVGVEANGHQLVLIAAHPTNPVRGNLDGWITEAAILSDFTAQFAGKPIVIAGDLNSVPEHYTIRDLISRNNLHEATQGWQPTYPADRLMPLITIDHVLATDQFRTVKIHRFSVSNTDHLGTIAELAQS